MIGASEEAKPRIRKAAMADEVEIKVRAEGTQEAARDLAGVSDEVDNLASKTESAGDTLGSLSDAGESASDAIEGLAEATEGAGGAASEAGGLIKGLATGAIGLAITVAIKAVSAFIKFKQEIQATGDRAQDAALKMGDLVNETDKLQDRSVVQGAENLRNIAEAAGAVAAKQAEAATALDSVTRQYLDQADAADKLRVAQINLAVIQGKMSKEQAIAEIGTIDEAAAMRIAMAEKGRAEARQVAAKAALDEAKAQAELTRLEFESRQADNQKAMGAVLRTRQDSALAGMQAKQISDLGLLASDSTVTEALLNILGPDKIADMLERMPGFMATINRVAADATGVDPATALGQPVLRGRLVKMLEDEGAEAAKKADEAEKRIKEADDKVLANLEAAAKAAEKTKEAREKEANEAAEAAKLAEQQLTRTEQFTIPAIQATTQGKLDVEKAAQAKRDEAEQEREKRKQAEAELDALKQQMSELSRADQTNEKGFAIASFIREKLHEADPSRDTQGMIPMLEQIAKALDNGTNPGELSRLMSVIPVGIQEQNAVMKEVGDGLRSIAAGSTATKAQIGSLRRDIEALQRAIKQL